MWTRKERGIYKSVTEIMLKLLYQRSDFSRLFFPFTLACTPETQDRGNVLWDPLSWGFHLPRRETCPGILGGRTSNVHVYFNITVAR